MSKLLGQGLYELDLRSLALLRICVGLLICLDILSRSRYLLAHYTDQGVIPREELLHMEPLKFSLYLAGGGAVYVGFLFLVTLALGVALTLGFHTRVSTFLCWFLMLSLHFRNPVVLNSGDVLLRMLLFWGFFLPWGNVWSVDKKEKTTFQSPRIRTLGSTGYFVQIMVVYVFAALLKSGDSWHDGTAIYYALNLDHFSTDLAKWVLEFPDLLYYLTLGVYYFEAFVWLFFVSPIFHGPLRTLGVLLLGLFHIGIALHLHLGMFSLIAVFSAVGLLPSWFWEQLGKRTHWKCLSLQEHTSDSPTTIAHRASETLAGLSLLLVLLWNVHSLDSTDLELPRTIHTIAHISGLDQKWSMFAPFPLVDDGWYVAEGILKNGKSVELLRNQELTWEKPGSVSTTYPSQRWRKYMINLYSKDFAGYRAPFLHYLAHKWNQNHRGPWEVEEIKLYYMLERTLPPQEEFKVEKLLLETYPEKR